jgi:hypothetical protein
MKKPTWFSRVLVLTLIASHLGALEYVHGAPVLLNPKEQGEGNVREFFSSNRDKRFLIRIHLWGDVGLAGVYYLPDNTTLLDALGYAGGGTGVLAKTEISLSRVVESKQDKAVRTEQTVKIGGDELIEKVDYRDMVLRNGDVIHLDSPPKTDHFMRALGIISTLLGITSTIIGVYLVTKAK